MKQIINRERVGLLKYDIRTLAVIADKMISLGADIRAWENIGDPIKQGHQVPEWIKEILIKEAKKNSNWGYSPTDGLIEAREFIAAEEKKAGLPLDKDNIVFTSGLGHGINMIYQALLGSGVRVIQPRPTYPAHSSSESFFSGQPPIFYNCRPENNWQPDINDLEKQIKKHPEIGFILTILPNNPTSVCYGDEILIAIASLARKHKLGIISDETYLRLVYKNNHQTSMAKIMTPGEPFPLLVMKSASKDIPWPGGRTGWLEFYNLDNDASFNDFKETVKQGLRVQVCSTTLPQAVLPKIYGDQRFPSCLKKFTAKLEEQSEYISSELNNTKRLFCVKGQGAFYLAAVFKEKSLRPGQSLLIKNAKVRDCVELLTSNPALPLDKRLTFYLMAATGIFVSPLSSFDGPLGFRVTTLKTDIEETKKVYTALKSAIEEYLNS